MEFINLSKYYNVAQPIIPDFIELKTFKCVWVTQELELVQDKDNIDYVKELVEKNYIIAPIRKTEPTEKYINRTDFPRRVILEMTSRCNFNCRMCPQQNLKRPRMDMDGRLYRRVVDELDEKGIEGLWIYHLGESILHPEFKQNVEHISKKKNLGVIWMSTNGQFFNEEIAKTVLNSNINFINFSAHAVTEETYKKVTPQGEFNIVQNNLEKIYELKAMNKLVKKPFIHTQMIDQEVTHHEVNAFIKKHYKKADIVSVNMLEYVNLKNNKFGLKQRERSSLTSCPRITRNSAFICSNGIVTPCDATYNGEITYGNIIDNTLTQIWQGEERKRILDLNSNGKMNEVEFCNQCPDFDVIMVGLSNKKAK